VGGQLHACGWVGSRPAVSPASGHHSLTATGWSHGGAGSAGSAVAVLVIVYLGGVHLFGEVVPCVHALSVHAMAGWCTAGRTSAAAPCMHGWRGVMAG